MNYVDIKNQIDKMMDENYEFFIKALISKETGIDNLDSLDEIY